MLFYSHFLRAIRLLNFGLWCVGIRHLFVLGALLCTLLGLGSPPGLLLGGLLGGLLGLDAREDGLPLGLDLLKVALHDGAGHGTELVHLGDVDALGGIVALVIEPVLRGIVSSSCP